MSRKQATHRGHCQACDRVQKLTMPNFVMALHGYSVQWQEFQGECPGSNYMPYEESCEFCKHILKGQRIHLEGLKKNVIALRTPTTEPKAWLYEYIARSDRHKFFDQMNVWRKIDFYMVEGDTFPHYLDYNGKEQSLGRQGGIGVHLELLEYMNVLNGKKATFVQQQVERTKKYIAWLEKRIAEWKRKELLPIAA